MKTSTLIKNLLIGSTVSLPLTFTLIGQAQAVVITNSLYNTGVDNTGAITSNGTADIHYSVVNNPTYSTVYTGQVFATNMYDNFYGPSTTAATDTPNVTSVGNYDYRTTFNISNIYSPSTASITGITIQDDALIAVLLNGQVIAGQTGGFSTNTPININSGFQSGINTLDFILNNVSGPTSLRTELALSANANSTSVPEPFTIMGTIIGGTAAFRMKKKLKAIAD